MGIAITLGVLLLLTLIFALCKSSGTKDDVDQKAIEYLTTQSEGRDGHIDELKQERTEDK